MLRPLGVSALVVSVLCIACDPGRTATPPPSDAPDPAPDVAPAAAPAEAPARPAPFAEVLMRMPANDRPDDALAAALIDAASPHLHDLGVVHEVRRVGGGAQLRVVPDSGSAFGRLATAMQRDAQAQVVYDPRAPAGWDAADNLLRLPYAAVLTGDVNEPSLLHERARAEVGGKLRRGEASPYYGVLVESNYTFTRFPLDALYADAEALAWAIRTTGNLAAAAADDAVLAADFAAVVAARKAVAPMARPLTEVEAAWNRVVLAALGGLEDADRIAAALREAKDLLRGAPAITYEPAAPGVRATLQIPRLPGQPNHPGYVLFLELARSGGKDDPRNPTLFRGQLLTAIGAVDRHREHFAAVLTLIDRIAAAAPKDRRAQLRALGSVAMPVSVGGTGPKAAAGYHRRFDQSLATP
jgi:hypothetical protein